MATRKKVSTKARAADNKAARKANSTALKTFGGFRARFRNDLKKMATTDAAATAAKENKAGASVAMLHHVRGYLDASLEALAESSPGSTAEANIGTVLDDWKENMRQMALELATKGVPIATLVPPKTEGGTATGKWSNYGNNVMSVAKGIIQFNLEVPDDVTFGGMRKVVEEARRNAASPEAKAIREARERASAAWIALRDPAWKSADVAVIDSLTAGLNALAEAMKATSAAQDSPMVEPEPVDPTAHVDGEPVAQAA